MHVCVSRTIPRSRGPGPPVTARVTRCSGHAALPGGREAGRGLLWPAPSPALVLCSLSSGRCYGRDVAAALIPFPSWMTTVSILSHSPLPGRLSLRPAEPWTSSSASPGTEVPGRGPRPLILGLSLPILPNTNLPLRPIRVWKLGTNSASCVGDGHRVLCGRGRDEETSRGHEEERDLWPDLQEPASRAAGGGSVGGAPSA